MVVVIMVVVVLLECSQLWCSASKLQKVFLRIARVTPVFSQLRDVSGEGGQYAACTVSDMSENTVWWWWSNYNVSLCLPVSPCVYDT